MRKGFVDGAQSIIAQIRHTGSRRQRLLPERYVKECFDERLPAMTQPQEPRTWDKINAIRIEAANSMVHCSGMHTLFSMAVVTAQAQWHPRCRVSIANWISWLIDRLKRFESVGAASARLIGRRQIRMGRYFTAQWKMRACGCVEQNDSHRGL